MKVCILYKIDDLQQYIQFEQINDLYQLNVIFAPFFLNFNIPFYYNEVPNPTIKVSTLPPKNETQWQKYKFQFFEGITIYSKYTDKLYFYYYIQCFKPEHHYNLKTMIFRSLMTSCMLRRNNLLYVHGMLLNNGDVIIGTCNVGKTTLYTRINQNNIYVKSLCDEDILLDLKNNLVYPIPHLYETNIVDFNSPIKISRIIVLKRGQEQKLEQMQQKEWKQILFESCILLLYHPFTARENNLTVNNSQIWVNCRKGLKQQAEDKIKEIITNIKDLEYLSITTNTGDTNQEFKVIQDNAEDVLIC